MSDLLFAGSMALAILTLGFTIGYLLGSNDKDRDDQA